MPSRVRACLSLAFVLVLAPGALRGQGVQGAPDALDRLNAAFRDTDRSAKARPVARTVIVLNGEGRSAGPINHLAVMTLVSPAYAPPGAHLICVNVVGSAPENDTGMEALEAEVRNQLRRWFGPSASSWQVVGGYPIAHALPLQLSMAPQRQAQSDTGILLCGDYQTTASIQGALTSGARAAQSLLSGPQ